MAKLEEVERKAMLAESHEAFYSPALQLAAHAVRVLLSIDERLAETNDFYLQNQEERNRPNG